MDGNAIAFYIFAAITIVASLGVVGQRNPMYSVMLLITSFGALAGLYVLAIILPSTRHFFELSPLDAGMVITSVVASAISIGALALAGFPVRAAHDDDVASQGDAGDAVSEP